MQIDPNESNVLQRIESERESLPFPAGGVFAGQTSPADSTEGDSEMITSTDDVIASIDRLFDVMQEQVDTISEEVDHSLRMPAHDDEFDPYSAA